MKNIRRFGNGFANIKHRIETVDGNTRNGSASGKGTRTIIAVKIVFV